MHGISKRIAAISAAMLFLGTSAYAYAQQVNPDVPSVSVRPAESRADDPNGGQWFYTALPPQTKATLRAAITNPADVAQHVQLYVRDVTFDDRGTAQIVEGAQSDVGSWGRFPKPDVTIGAKQTVIVPFEVSAPADADPGDHVGAVVAQSDPQGGDLKKIFRVAVRLYVTIPGEAIRRFEIASIRTSLDSIWWPKRMQVGLTLRNTGRVRLKPVVTVRGRRAKGADVLLARSVEQYFADITVPWYGGPLGLQIQAIDDGGLIRRAKDSTFVVPWGLIVAIITAVGVAWLIRKWWRERAGRVAALQADVRRLEMLVAQRPTGVTTTDLGPDSEADDSAEIHTILAGLKRARRANSYASFRKLALALHETGADALGPLLEALEHPGDDIEALLSATATYGGLAIATAIPSTKLAEETSSRLLTMVSKPKPRPKPKPKSVKAKPIAKAKSSTRPRGESATTLTAQRTKRVSPKAPRDTDSA